MMFISFCAVHTQKDNTGGVESHYSDRGSDIWKSARRIMGLPFVMENDIANAWEEVKARFPPSPMMIPIADYFEQTWLGNGTIFPFDTLGQWHNVVSHQCRTNNQIQKEGYHSALKVMCEGSSL